MSDYISSRPAPGAAAGVEFARTDAEENALSVPSAATLSLLSALAAGGSAAHGTHGAVAVTPAAGAVGLSILHGLAEKAAVTCIDPEAAHQASAREAFRLAGFPASRARFLTARPLDVMGRLAPASYRLVYLDVDPVEFGPAIDVAWPLVAQGGTVVIAGSLLDGTVADPTRRDRATEAARAADAAAEELSESGAATIARLPLDGGLTLITKR
ncbi:methyltransferase [Corynebacterium liangguodongii]|uniref:Methyltransferase n=2 Tax=Corynebacterium liangguodongii TaxID=2079535 RepID=A0A2S0WDE2_9CORY|nr:methyltransferase [Corynebacterium liangguodongii]PWB98916.1 methyltransferase [Corynebacterium liangguodongii]